MMKRFQNNRFLRKIVSAGIAGGLMLLCLAALCLSGCKKEESSDGKNQNAYSTGEIMIVAMAEKNRYQAVYTDQIWSVPVPGGEGDFAGYLTDQIKSFMENMKMMNALADERNIELTATERSAMSAAAEEYYKSLSEEDISHMGLSKEKVLNVYEDYRMANKLMEELTKEINLEVSDSEVKVITIMQAKTNSRPAADSMYQTASLENADFQKSAENAGLTVSQRELGREEENKVFEDAAFALSTGQMSQVIEDGDSFYVLKCISDYEEAATKARKDLVYEERKRKAFEEIYNEYKSSIDIPYDNGTWENIDLAGENCAENADFFGIYKKHAQ